jgi:hypothetical protein
LKQLEEVIFNNYLLILVIVWNKELSKYKFGRISLKWLMIIIVIAFFLSRFEIKDIAFSKGWLPQGINETAIWMSNSSEIYMFSTIDKDVMLNISLINYRGKTLELYMNGNFLNAYISPGSVVEIVKLKKGENKLLFKSREGCEFPLYVENQLKCSNFVECMKMNISTFNISFDARCLSFGIVNISIIPIDTLLTKDVSIFYGSGFYPQEKYGRWMGKNATIYIYSNNEKKVFLDISFSFYKNKNETFLLLLNNQTIGAFQGSRLFELINLKKGFNEVKFISNACYIPALEEVNSSDFRCLSIFIKEFRVEDIGYVDFFDEEEWNGMKFRWFSTNSKVYILSNKTNLFLLKFNAWTIPNQTRILKIYVNDMRIREYNVSEEIKPIYLPLVLRKGINEMLFVLDECGYVANDIRCLGAAISEIRKEDINIQSMEKITNGFYGLEKAYGGYFRWLSNKGEISLFSFQNVSVKLYVKIGWTYFSDRNLNITLNDKLIFAEKIAKNGKEFSTILNLVKGWNKIKFTSTCDVPASLEFSKDKRCLSLAFMSLSFLPSNP